MDYAIRHKPSGMFFFNTSVDPVSGVDFPLFCLDPKHADLYVHKDAAEDATQCDYMPDDCEVVIVRQVWEVEPV